jgi:signal transduction histidine kinase
MEDTLAEIIQVVGVDAAGIRLIDFQTNVLNFVYGLGLSSEFTAVVQEIPLGQGTVGVVAQTGEPALIEDMLAHTSSDPVFRAMMIKEGIRARVEVPLHSRERIVGTLGVASRTPGAFGKEDIDLLTAIGHQLGVAIENAQLRQEALDAERWAAVGRVATSVAHDLRSPLGGIMRSAEFLSRPELSQATRQKLSGAVVSMSRRLVNTAQQILDFVHEERLPLKRAPCMLSEFLDEVLAVLEVDFSDRGIEVIRDCCYQGEVVIDGDRMAQVVYNIAANARDAMPNGGTFKVSSRKIDQIIELRMSDSGPGVPNEYADRIFEPFFTYGKRQGAGLGLSITRRIVEEHDGNIRLESGDEQGATFIITLPIK